MLWVKGAALSALTDQAFIEEMQRKKTAGVFNNLFVFCEENGMKYFPSQANFILINFGRERGRGVLFFLFFSS